MTVTRDTSPVGAGCEMTVARDTLHVIKTYRPPRLRKDIAI